MSERGILLSERHGVNPAVMQCYVCMKDVGVALFGRMRGDHEAPPRVCLDREPCDECKKLMKKGVILISVKDSDVGSDNPYRTGGWVVIKDEAVTRAMKDDAAKSIIASRMAFVPDKVWDAWGLPREKTK